MKRTKESYFRSHLSPNNMNGFSGLKELEGEDLSKLFFNFILNLFFLKKKLKIIQKVMIKEQNIINNYKNNGLNNKWMKKNKLMIKIKKKNKIMLYKHNN